ncbi:MAG TPA: M48 family metallopeptidase [Croceibacterium sp.]|nr:M48 family metallopeptidase [Croceibacterium sp.]
MKSSAILAIVVATMAFAQQSAAQTPDAIDPLVVQDARLASIATRMLVANDHLCRQHMPVTGIVLHSSDQYKGGVAQGAFRNGNIAVEAVVPGSAAAIAGVEADDGLAAIANGPVSELESQGQAPLRDSAYAALADLHGQREIEITVRREGVESLIRMAPPQGCRALVEVLSDRGISARSDGRVIQVSYGLASAADDSQLAVIFAHEMGHLVLEHRRRLTAAGVEKGFLGEFGKNRRLNRQVEVEADRIAVHLLANAGYDPASAAAFWRTRLGRRAGGGLLRSGTYPSPEARAALSESEIAEYLTDRERPSDAAHLMSLRDQPFD